ncbi:MAG TPA: histidine kinase [Methanophagales archaeon]|nr:histidine kinase [Methanophagales archaeon]
MKSDNRVVILVICIILICIVTFLGFKTHGEVKTIVQEQFNEQQLLLTRQSAARIESFLKEKIVLIEVLATDLSDVSPENMSQRFIPIYHKSSGFSSIGFVNSTGVIVSGYPVNASAIGLDLYATNRSGSFERAKDSGKTYTTNPVLLVQGGVGSTIGVPVYSDDEFKGVVFAIIEISTISERFLADVMPEGHGYAYMITKSGRSLYDEVHGELIGKKYIGSFCTNNSSYADILRVQRQGHEGTGYYFDELSGERWIAAYTPVFWHDRVWSVATSVPASEVDHLIQSVYAKQMLFLGTVIAIILFGSFGLIMMFSRWNRTLEAEVKSKTSDLIQMNKELALANARLKELDKLKSEFVSIVSHELKTPLAAMKTSTQVMGMADASEETRQEMQKIIIRNIDRQTNLVNDLLDLSKIESGRLKLNCEDVTLDALIADSIETVNQAAVEKGITLDAKLPEGLPSVKGDQEKLIRVVINILNNAIKFTPGGGTIIIKARELNGQVEVRVSDTGIGISPEELAKVFEKFYQVDSTLAREAGGTGLGLAICKGIIEAHNGRIWVESEFGRGSIFSFTLEKWGT